MADRTRATSVMTVDRFYPDTGTGPALLLREQAATPGGGRRAVSMRVLVPNRDLFRRVQESVREGDEIRVTTETNWDALHDSDTLLSFEPIGVRSAAAPVP
jgi:hypothetical protein